MMSYDAIIERGYYLTVKGFICVIIGHTSHQKSPCVAIITRHFYRQWCGYMIILLFSLSLPLSRWTCFYVVQTIKSGTLKVLYYK